MRYLSALVLLLLSLYSVSAATIHGSIYNDHLQLEPDVLVSVDSQPQQKFLAKDGSYIFTLALGKYTLTAQKEDTIVLENINIISDGEYVVDLFLLPGVSEEEDLWNETTQDYFTEESTLPQNWWRYTLISLIVLFALYRIYRARKKYGSLPFFRRKIKAESHKTIEQHQEELAKEPGYLDNALEIIKRHQGRITQKELRKEMLYLSEAKVSLILTELEHKGRIERVKKGRGNVILLKEKVSEPAPSESVEGAFR